MITGYMQLPELLRDYLKKNIIRADEDATIFDDSAIVKEFNKIFDDNKLVVGEVTIATSNGVVTLSGVFMKQCISGYARCLELNVHSYNVQIAVMPLEDNDILAVMAVEKMSH